MKKKERQLQILEYFERFSAQYRYPPTVRDIQDYLGIKSTATVFKDLSELAENGLIERVKNRFVPSYTESYIEQIKRCVKKF